NDRLNLNQTLYKSAKEYVQDKHYFQLKQNKDFDWDLYEKSKKKLRENIRELRQESLEIAKNVLNLLEEKNIEIADFAGGANGIGGFFFKTLSNKQKLYTTLQEEENCIERIRKGASAKGKAKQSEILEILDFLLFERQKIIANYVEIE